MKKSRLNQSVSGDAVSSTSEFGTYVVTGPILDQWRTLGGESGWLGHPVSEELQHPSRNSSYVVFEHGFIERPNDGSPPTAARHDYLRLYGALRAQILSRFFAIGFHGRRNLLGTDNLVRSHIPDVPVVRASTGQPRLNKVLAWLLGFELQEQIDEHNELALQALRARWDTVATGGENPHLFGTWLFAMLAVEHAAGNQESTNALRQALETIENLSQGAGGGQVPTRWDAGAPTDDLPENAQLDDALNHHVQQFITHDGAVPRVQVPPSDFHHHPWRHETTLRNLMTKDQATEYQDRQFQYAARYRDWEPSMDEVTGMVTSLWLVNKLSTDRDILSQARRQAQRVGQYLSTNGYMMLKPLGGLSWRGGTGVLPMMEEPIARALLDITDEDFHSQADFQQAMELAGHWRQLAAPIGAWQAFAWGVTISGLASLTAAADLAAVIAVLELIFAGQVVSPSAIGAAAAICAGHWDCLDVSVGAEARDDQGNMIYQTWSEILFAIFGKDAPNKVGLYRAFVQVAARLDASKGSFAVHFPGFLSLTGLDNADSLVRDAFADWFNIRSTLPANLEPAGTGASVKCWVAAVATIFEINGNPEAELLNRLDSAVCHLFSRCYFDPQIPTFFGEGDELMREKLCVYKDHIGPYGPLDFCAAIALACWHAQRREAAGNPVTTAGFPGPMIGSVMANWSPAGVPVEALDVLQSRGLGTNVIQSTGSLVSNNGSYPVFLDPPVPRRLPPVAPNAPASVLTDIRVFFLDPRTTGDLATGISLENGQALEVRADGDIWAGNLLEGRNGADGLETLVDDARWPLHTGLNGGASKYCVLGRLNGYFFIGTHFPKQKWVFDDARELFLRINDPEPGDGNGGFVVRVDVFGPEGSLPHEPYDLLRDGGLVRTDEPRDRIFVRIEPGNSGSNAVEFALETPDEITWRKELVMTSGNAADPRTLTIHTQDARHLDVNGLGLDQLAGGSLVLRRLYPWPAGMEDVFQIHHLERANPGSRIVFRWYQD